MRILISENPRIRVDYALFTGMMVNGTNMNRGRVAIFTPAMVQVYMVNNLGFYRWEGESAREADGSGWLKYTNDQWCKDLPWYEDEWLGYTDLGMKW